ncbi:hypothetical protein FACS1894184_15390 [Clostridia bacterium]|nr:hypothetical protein FACS1894184_15390 [Clostridia bacterium]
MHYFANKALEVLKWFIGTGKEIVLGLCLSTDKAAYPINAMGTSKAMMEHVIRANQYRQKGFIYLYSMWKRVIVVLTNAFQRKRIDE